MRSCADKEWPQYNTTETAPLIFFSIVRVDESCSTFYQCLKAYSS